MTQTTTTALRTAIIAIAVPLIVITGSAQTPESTLAIAGRSNSTPWIAGAGRFVAVAWGATSDRGGDIYAATSRDGGRSFGSPVQVNATAGEARISGELAPRVSLYATNSTADPEIVVLWNAKDTATSIRLARSKDGGRTFGAPQTLQTGGSAGDRGWGAVTVDAKGNAHAIWLDHRGMASGGEHAEHKGEHDGVAVAQRSALYYGSVSASGVRERSLFPGVCYCCKTALAAGPDGALYAAWRHVFAGNFRDIGFTVSRDGGATFAPMTRVNQDGWSINGCPDDGPAMAVDASGVVHLAWPTVSNEAGVILYATSRDGRTFTKPMQVPTFGSPKASHPQIAIDGSGAIYVGWDEVRSGARAAGIIEVKSTAKGVEFGAPEPIGAVTAYPVMAPTERGLVAAWTSGPPNQSVIKVRRVK